MDLIYPLWKSNIYSYIIWSIYKFLFIALYGFPFNVQILGYTKDKHLHQDEMPLMRHWK